MEIQQVSLSYLFRNNTRRKPRKREDSTRVLWIPRLGPVILRKGFVMFFTDVLNAVVDKVVDWAVPIESMYFDFDEDEI